MKEGLLQGKECTEKCVSKNERVTNILPVKIVIEGHRAGVNDDLSSVEWALDILIDCTSNARKGISQPHATPPSMLNDLDIWLAVHRSITFLLLPT